MIQNTDANDTAEEESEELNSIHPDDVKNHYTPDEDGFKWDVMATVERYGGNIEKNLLREIDGNRYAITSQRRDGKVEVEGTEHESGLTLRLPNHTVKKVWDSYEEMGVLWGSEGEYKPNEGEFLEWVENTQTETVCREGLTVWDYNDGEQQIQFN